MRGSYTCLRVNSLNLYDSSNRSVLTGLTNTQDKSENGQSGLKITDKPANVQRKTLESWHNCCPRPLNKEKKEKEKQFSFLLAKY